MFTDIITLGKDKQTIYIHFFDASSSNYTQKVSFKPDGCKQVINIQIGRSDKTIRFFVTCLDVAGRTLLKMYDRNMNNELGSGKRDLEESEIINKMIKENNMVFKTLLNLKSMNFEPVSQTLYMTKNSQPFISDLNGDYIDDIIFNNQEDTSKNGKLNVAIFNLDTDSYDVGNFKNKMVDPECGGLNSKIDAPSLTSPHSVSMVDFDGDCLDDLFITVQDEQRSKAYYEIYVRRERVFPIDTPVNQMGLGSFCLA